MKRILEWQSRRTHYVGESIYCLSPNGTHWILWGRILYVRMGRRHQFMVRVRKHARGWSFGFGPRLGGGAS
jgi:hypothetical protein